MRGNAYSLSEGDLGFSVITVVVFASGYSVVLLDPSPRITRVFKAPTRIGQENATDRTRGCGVRNFPTDVIDSRMGISGQAKIQSEPAKPSAKSAWLK